MLDQLLVNMDVHFKFYLRNRLLHVIGLLFLFLTGLSAIPAMFTASSNKQLMLITQLYSELNVFTLIFTAGLGLFLISSHVRNRNIKMVLTKPCLPETWLLSGFLTAILISFTLYFFIFLFSAVISIAMGIPFQPGLIYISSDYFMRSTIFLSYLMFLSMVMHPVMAVLIALIFNEGTFYGLKFLLMVISKAFGGTAILRIFGHLVDVLYMALPMTEPLAERSERVYATMRVENVNWVNLFDTALYAFAIAGLFFYLSDWFLKRKRLT